MTTGLGLFGFKFLDPQPDVSSIAQDRKFLTSMVMLPSPSDFGGWIYGDWLSQLARDFAKRWYLLVQLLHWDGGISISR